MYLRATLLLLLLAGPAAAAPLPEDTRIAAARPELQSLVDDAARAGLPSDLIVDKVREGLAKNVPPPRIVAAARTLAAALAEARELAAARLHTRPADLPPALLRALAEARAGGSSPRELDSLLTALAARRAPLPAATRAAEALADLVARGFSPAAAGRAVTTLIDRGGADSAQLDHLGIDATRLWHQNGGPPDAALDEAAHADEHGAREHTEDHGPNRETSGQRGPAHGKSKN
jgi:hypothetical protein